MRSFFGIYGKLITRGLAAAILLSAFCACDLLFPHQKDDICGICGEEKPCGCESGPAKVFMMYSIGFNNLSSYLKEDINELADSYASIKGNNRVVIFSHSTKSYRNYLTPNPPVVIELKKDGKGGIVRDTILTMEPNTVSASKETLHEFLSFVKERYQEAEYSILFSSHGTGWAPANYCNDPDDYENTYPLSTGLMRASRTSRRPSWGEIPEDGGPVVKSFGVQNITSSSYHEMDITDIAEAFPMKMKTVIFDACFMGGVEVAYQLRDVTEKMVASQTEILADGMDYTTMLSYILKNDDIEGFCESFYNFYLNKSRGDEQSATISLIDCTRLESVAEICREIFSSQKEQIASLEGSSSVQRYFRRTYSDIHKWFYDLEDIVMHTDATDEQKERLQMALEECVLYKAATEKFILDITLANHCGLSMYLPYRDRAYLNNFYKSLAWNKATGLVE